MELSETTQLVFDRVAALNPSRIVFDSLSEMRLLAQNSLRYRRQILALKHFFTGRRCTVLMLDDMSSKSDDLQLHSIAHGVVMLEQVAVDYGSERRRLRVVKMRGMPFRGGFHDFSIRRGGLEIFPRLVAAEHRQAFAADPVAERQRRAGFDGGRRAGTRQQRAAAGRRRRRQVHPRAQLRHGGGDAGRARRGLCLRRGAGHHPGAAPPRSACRCMGRWMAGLVSIQQVDPAELSPGEFAHRVRRAVEQDGARVVIIDSLNGYLSAMPDERFLVLQMHELLSTLNQLGVLTILVLAQHGLVGPMQTPLDHQLPQRCGADAALLRARGRGPPGAVGGEEAQRHA